MMNKNRHPRLLIVDDQPSSIQHLRALFPPDYDIFMATDAKSALQVSAHCQPDLILLDVVMPGINGLELAKTLKKRPATHNVPIIFITTLHSPKDEIACWTAGCVDFVNKPVSPLTLLNRVNAHLTLKRQADYFYEQSTIDGLTGIANRRLFDERIDMEFKRAKRNGNPLALMLMDVDFFKSYNDMHGHLAGDDCLKKIAETLKKTLKRPADLVARYGGEEFVCLLPETNKIGALSIAEQLRCFIQSLHIENSNSSVAAEITISIGIAVYPDTECKSTSDLIDMADKHLYKAKNSGRNRCCG